MDIRIRGLDPAPFQPLFAADPATLAADLAVIRTVESSPGSPCRVTLEDAAPGETVALLNHTHHDVATPFRSAHAIYVRKDAREAFDAVNVIPPAFARRTISLRGFDAEGWMVTEEDLLLAKHSNLTLCRALRSQGSGKNLPWKVVMGGTETKHRDLSAGLVIAAQMGQVSRRRPAVPAKKPSGRPRGLLESATAHPTLDKKGYSQQMVKLQTRLGRLSRLAAAKGLSTMVVLEGPDAAGKGGAIRRLCGLLDAAHYQVFPTPAPTPEEKARHYLWRFWNKVPAPGHLAVFDRSWFGRVMVERVEGFAKDAEWARAYAEINDFEARLAETGMVVLKLWINISKEEQLRRFHAREISPHKRHKMTKEDYRNRKKWDANVRAAEDMIARTDTPHAPWVVVSGDDKRYARVATLKAVCRALSDRLD